MPRKIWVSTTAFQNRGGPTIEANIAKAAALIDEAATDRPDIICLPETFAYLGMPKRPAAEVAEAVPGPITDMAMKKAKAYGTNIICPLLEKRGEQVYNVAVIIDRRGQIVGIYEKLHPVTTSSDFTVFERGVCAGSNLQTFDLDFGRIGVLICFDIQWPADWAHLKEMGAEIVFWPSAYDGGFPLRARAWDHHYYVVSAVQSRTARIINISGKVLAATGARSGVITTRIDLEKRYFHTDFNASQIPAIKAKYGRNVKIELFDEEGGMTLESHQADLSVADLMTEFDLELVPDYVARHDFAEPFTRRGEAAPAQPPRQVPAQYV